MRQFACVLLALACGCASMQDDARIRRQAEAVVWSAMAAPTPALREHATRIAAGVADPLLDRGLGARLVDPSPSVRAVAAVAMVKQLPVAADVLAQALDGNDAAAKVIAIDAIGALPDGKSRLGKLAADRDVRVRSRVATAIAEQKPADARTLLGALVHDEDASVRVWALAGLARLGDQGALGEVTQALDDPSLGVRLAALGALVELGRDAVKQTLLALGSGKDPYLALRAAVKLSHGDREPVVLPAVRTAADDRNAAVRVAAMNAAGELGRDGQALAQAHLRDADVSVRLAAARAVITTGRPDLALPVLLSALSTPERFDAAYELARIGDARGVSALQAAARSPDVMERRIAIGLLAPLPAGHDALVAALADADAEIRLDAAGVLLGRLLRYER